MSRWWREPRVFCQQFGFASGQIGECTNRGGGRWWLYPPQNLFVKRMEAEKDAWLDRGKHAQHKENLFFVKMGAR